MALHVHQKKLRSSHCPIRLARYCQRIQYRHKVRNPIHGKSQSANTVQIAKDLQARQSPTSWLERNSTNYKARYWGILLKWRIDLYQKRCITGVADQSHIRVLLHRGVQFGIIPCAGIQVLVKIIIWIVAPLNFPQLVGVNGGPGAIDPAD